MIDIKDISFGYSCKGCPIFRDFSLSIGDGNICGLLGRNGTGKSTLLYLLSGLLFPTEGEVLLNGQNVAQRRPEILSQIFLLPEEFSLPSMRLSSYVKLNKGFYPNFSDEIFNACLSDFGLEDSMNPTRLSMGQKKKAFMAFALAANTPLLLMDEPTNGLDIPSKAEFRRVVARYAGEDKTILISTHQVRDIDSLLDYLVVIDGNELLLNAPVKDVLAKWAFAQRPLGEPIDDALYSEPSVSGNALVVEATQGEESPLDLELLFNGLISKRLIY